MPSSAHKDPTFVSGLPMAAMASRSLAGVIFGLRPPLRPLARAEARPARVRSEIKSRSNSAREAKMPKISLPAGVVVSIAAPWPVSTLRPMPRFVRSCTTFTRCRRLRPRRSSFQTTSVSPFLSACRHEERPGRSSFLPDALSPYRWRSATPAARSASRCRSSTCDPSAFDTRMYPIRGAEVPRKRPFLACPGERPFLVLDMYRNLSLFLFTVKDYSLLFLTLTALPDAAS